MAEINFAKYEAFSFDFDGILADSIGTHTTARLLALKAMANLTGNPAFASIPSKLQAEAHRHGSNPMAIIGWLLRESGIVPSIDDPLVKQTVDLKKSTYKQLCQEGLEQIPGSVDLLLRLSNQRRNGIYITTTAHRDEEVAPFLERHHLRGVVADDRIISFDDTGPHHLKPDPLAYALTLERAKLTDRPDKLLIFEDTPHGIVAAKKVGATAVAVCTTHSADSFGLLADGLRPDYVFSDFAALLDNFDKGKMNI